MQTQIENPEATFGGNDTPTPAAVTVHQYFQQALQRRTERSSLPSVRSGMCIFSGSANDPDLQ